MFTPSTDKNWDIQIDDTIYKTGTLNIIEYLNKHSELALMTGENEGFWGIMNSSNRNRRITLIAKNLNKSPQFFSDSTMGIESNPTAWIRNNNIYFCLNYESSSDLTYPIGITHDGSYLIAAVGSKYNRGIYTITGNQIDLSTNFASSKLSTNIVISGDDTIVLSQDGVNLARTKGPFYDTELIFDPALPSASSTTVNYDGSYILTAILGGKIQIYKRQSDTKYLKIGETNEQYFTGLHFSPDGTKFCFFDDHSPRLIVYHFSNGVATQLDGLGYIDANTNAKSIANPIWLYNNIILRSYVYIDQQVNLKGYLEIIKVEDSSLILLDKIDIGATYYRFEKPQSGRCLVTTDTGLLRLLDISHLGKINFDTDYSEFVNRSYVLTPSGQQLILNSQHKDQVERIDIHSDGTYTR